MVGADLKNMRKKQIQNRERAKMNRRGGNRCMRTGRPKMLYCTGMLKSDQEDIGRGGRRV